MVADVEVDKVPDMEVDKVADMEVDMVADVEVDMVPDMEVDKVAAMVATKLFYAKVFSSQNFCDTNLPAYLLSFELVGLGFVFVTSQHI